MMKRFGARGILQFSIVVLAVSPAAGESFWSLNAAGRLVAFDVDLQTGASRFTMQAAGDPFGNIEYRGIARQPVTGTLWAIYVDISTQHEGIGRLEPGAGIADSVLLPERFTFPAPHPKFSPAGELYVAAYDRETNRHLLATLDTESGSVSPVITLAPLDYIGGLAFNPADGKLYVSGGESCVGGCVAFIDTLTVPQHQRERIFEAAGAPAGEPLFGPEGEVLLMDTLFYRLQNGALEALDQALTFSSPFGPFVVTLFEGSPAEGTEGCVPTVSRGCLQHRRFAVEATYDASAFGGSVGSAVPQLESDQSLKFSFFEPEILELFVKIVDGCSYNGHYWVFASGLTNLAVSLRLSDTVGGTTYVHENPAGQTFDPVLDIYAFDCGS